MRTGSRLLIAASLASAFVAVAIVALHGNSERNSGVPTSQVYAAGSVATSGLSSNAQPSTNKPIAPNHPVIDWNREFQNATDYFPLIAKAAKAGLAGDGRAAYFVSRKWLECASVVRQYSGVEHPENQFNEEMNRAAHAPPEWVDRRRKQFQRCSGFYSGNSPDGNDVFADLPRKEAGDYNSPKFWMDLAYRNNDPLAQTVHASLALSGASANTTQVEVAQADINKAVASGDPDALFSAGMMITNGLYVDPIEGYALSLAACDLGHDCTAVNSSGSDLPFGDCVISGTCASGSVFSDWVAKNLGADGYAQAYARAQEIKEALAQGDLQMLQQFAKLKN
jgi:hypothetical protein